MSGIKNTLQPSVFRLQPLSILPTPIGNLGDLSHRVEETLSECDLVVAEDTRRAEQLLNHLESKSH